MKNLDKIVSDITRRVINEAAEQQQYGQLQHEQQNTQMGGQNPVAKAAVELDQYLNEMSTYFQRLASENRGTQNFYLGNAARYLMRSVLKLAQDQNFANIVQALKNNDVNYLRKLYR